MKKAEELRHKPVRNPYEEPKDDWRDPNSGCYCVVCLAPVRQDIFTQRQGCCPNHKPDDECTYT
jgi:hypothetical protein